MADAGLFIGFGQSVRGREAKSLEVFNEGLAWFAQQQRSGAFESFEAVLVNPHGGDLGGFILLKGTGEQMATLPGNEEFQRLITRAGLVVEGLGVVPAVVGDGVGRQLAAFQAAIGELA